MLAPVFFYSKFALFPTYLPQLNGAVNAMAIDITGGMLSLCASDSVRLLMWASRHLLRCQNVAQAVFMDMRSADVRATRQATAYISFCTMLLYKCNHRT